MQRTFKTRLKVNDVESNILAQWCGVSRLAYNVCLDQWNRDYENGVKHNYYSIKKWFNSVKREMFPLHHRRQQMGARSGHQGSRHRVQEHVSAYGQAPAIPQEGRPRLVPHRRLGDSREREKPETAERPMPEAYGKVQI